MQHGGIEGLYAIIFLDSTLFHRGYLLPVVCELLGITDIETLVEQLIIIRDKQ